MHYEEQFMNESGIDRAFIPWRSGKGIPEELVLPLSNDNYDFEYKYGYNIDRYYGSSHYLVYSGKYLYLVYADTSWGGSSKFIEKFDIPKNGIIFDRDINNFIKRGDQFLKKVKELGEEDYELIKAKELYQKRKSKVQELGKDFAIVRGSVEGNGNNGDTSRPNPDLLEIFRKHGKYVNCDQRNWNVYELWINDNLKIDVNKNDETIAAVNFSYYIEELLLNGKIEQAKKQQDKLYKLLYELIGDRYFNIESYYVGKADGRTNGSSSYKYMHCFTEKGFNEMLEFMKELVEKNGGRSKTTLYI